jgi:general secretion pathway protein J
MRRPPAPRTQSGFTLLELMLAMTLTMVLMGLVYASVRMTIRATESGEAMVDRTNRVRITQEFLRRQLNRAMPLIIETGARDGKTRSFEGTASEIRWVGPMPGYLGSGGPYIQSLELERARDGYELVYRFEMLNGYDPERRRSADDIDAVVLLEGIRRGRFQYRSLDANNLATPWTGTWKDPATMPVMVQIDLTMTPESRLDFPRLEIPVMVDAGGAFARDFQSASP